MQKWAQSHWKNYQQNLFTNHMYLIYMYEEDLTLGGARGVMVIIVRNGHDDTSSKAGRDW